MELAQLIDALSNPAAYPFPVQAVEVRQTHISVVFLAGPYVYKVKKPLQLGFLDFSTLEKRRHFCDEEVRLNRRLAPTVYLGVVAISRTGAGLKIEGTGEPVEWAVKMERLPEDATLQKRLQRGTISPPIVQSLGQRLASFHAGAEAGERISAFGQFDVVARNARENFEQAAAHVGITVSQVVFETLRGLTEDTLDRLKPLIGSRAQRGMARDTHGDLHLDHVYLFPDRTPPDDLVIVDCIEFNERFRFADPVADMAFLVMDLKFRGQKDLAQVFAEAYFNAAKDDDGRPLLPFYTAYRSVVRAKVNGFALAEKEIPEKERRAAHSRARGHWLLALGELEAPGRRPWLILVGGLPGTGKSTLARGLAEQAGFCWVRSDEVRKELAGIPANEPARFGHREGIYTLEWTDRTYAECLSRAEKFLFEGKRVVVDANFGAERRRLDFLDLAARLATPAVFLHCNADPEIVRQRLDRRQGDASDADWAVYQNAAQGWEEFGSSTKHVVRTIASAENPQQTLTMALGLLRELFLMD
jgi:aminoglycoside phosphotransferase family enzyme/predicted kinase